MLNFVLFIKGFVTNFSTTLCVCFFKMFFYVNWRNFIVWLPLLLEILGNMCMVIICFPVCDVINSELTLASLSSRFPTWPEKSGQNFEYLKGTLMQIWKSANIFMFIWKYYAENFTLEHILLFERCVREKCEKSVYKHSETMDYVKN